MKTDTTPRYEHVCKTGNDVCPDRVDERTFGPHRSTVVKGVRIWAFRDRDGAELFLIYANRGEFRRQKRPAPGDRGGAAQ